MGTYLYIKTHNETGLKYFGKTTTPDPEKYPGSGKHWVAHIKKHGINVTTEILGYYEDIAECSQVALEFSRTNNIVSSPEWANLIEENGIDGAPKGHEGHKFTNEQRQKMSSRLKERWDSPEYRDKLARSQKASWTDERKRAQSERAKLPWSEEKRKNHAHKLSSKKRKPNKNKIIRSNDYCVRMSNAMKHPKIKLCRLSDRKEMSLNQFTMSLNSVCRLVGNKEMSVRCFTKWLNSTHQTAITSA